MIFNYYSKRYGAYCYINILSMRNQDCTFSTKVCQESTQQLCAPKTLYILNVNGNKLESEVLPNQTLTPSTTALFHPHQSHQSELCSFDWLSFPSSYCPFRSTAVSLHALSSIFDRIVDGLTTLLKQCKVDSTEKKKRASYIESQILSVKTRITKQ